MNGKTEQYSPGMQALVQLLRYSFVVLSVSIAALLAWYVVFAGYFTVHPQETAIVLRFGKIIGEFKEGWHWVYPYPISRVVKIPTTKQTIRTRSFWHKVDAKSYVDGAPQGGPLNPAVEGYLLTGDANIIHSEWELVYEINDPTKYYTRLMTPQYPFQDDEILKSLKTGNNLGTRGPRTFLKSLFDNVVVRTTAAWSVDDALYKNSAEYNRQVLANFAKELAKWDFGINIEALEVNFTGKTPPLMVNPAFQNVIGAEADMSKDIQNAREYAVKKDSEAEAEKADVISLAKVYRSRIVSQIESEENYFRKILEEYRKSPDTVLLALYNDGVSEFLFRVKDKYLIPPGGRDKQELRIMLNPEPQAPRNEEAKDGVK
jgi:membrane protease subunit HflK